MKSSLHTHDKCWGVNKLKTEANLTTSFGSMTEVLIVAILSWFTGLQFGQSGFTFIFLKPA